MKAIAGKFRRNFRVQRLRCRNIRVAGTGIASLQFSVSATIQRGWHFGIEPQYRNQQLPSPTDPTR
ncbi:MAG: hypothetical protein WBO12_16575, partial [Xanthobacteraceae bacterium]